MENTYFPLRAMRTLAGHDNGVCQICLSEDNEFLYSASADMTLQKWDLSRGESVLTFSSHADAVRCCLPLKEDPFLLSGGDDAAVMLWDVD